MSTRQGDYIEILNEMTILLTSYFMIICCESIADVEVRYYFGFYYIFLMIPVILINILIIVY